VGHLRIITKKKVIQVLRITTVEILWSYLHLDQAYAELEQFVAQHYIFGKLEKSPAVSATVNSENWHLF
jgi:hypothetical protein